MAKFTKIKILYSILYLQLLAFIIYIFLIIYLLKICDYNNFFFLKKFFIDYILNHIKIFFSSPFNFADLFNFIIYLIQIVWILLYYLLSYPLFKFLSIFYWALVLYLIFKKARNILNNERQIW